MNKAAYYKYSYWGVVQSTIYIIVLAFLNFNILFYKYQINIENYFKNENF